MAESTRKTAQQVADESLETAERVLEKATAREAKLAADHAKAVEAVKMATRRVRAAKIIALDEAMDAIEASPTDAAEPAGADVL